MKKGIIVSSFGTTYKETRDLCIGSIENLIKEEFEGDLVLRAFTSEIVRRILKERDKLTIDNVPSALERLKEKGISNIYIQPLHIIAGIEYEKILRQVERFKERGENKDFSIKIGSPLLSGKGSYERVIEALSLPEDKPGRGLVYMGHGSSHEADQSYENLERAIRKKGFENVFIGTIEGSKGIDCILKELKEKQIRQVDLKPFLLVAGDHANNDMASDDKDSWKSILERNNIEVTTELKGLGQVKEIQNIFLNKLRELYQ